MILTEEHLTDIHKHFNPAQLPDLIDNIKLTLEEQAVFERLCNGSEEGIYIEK